MNQEITDVIPKELSALVEQGVKLRQEGKTAEAVKVYQQAAAMPGAPGAVFFNLGNALMDLGNLVNARQSFEEALQREPTMEPAALQLARCAVRMNDPKQARDLFAQILKANPNHFTAWLEAGHLCRQLGIPAQALISYQRAVIAAPERWEGLLSLARELEDAGRFEEAAVHYHRALPLAANKPGGIRQVHRLMGRYRMERGDTARALESMRQTLGMMRIEKPEPDVNERADVQIDLGEVLMRLGLHAEAHRAFERASVATSEQVLSRLASQSFQNNLWVEAQEVLKRNVELHPQSATAYWNLAHSYAESWMMEEAMEALAKAEALAPQPGAKSMRASVAGRLGDVDTAMRLYRELSEQEGARSAMRSSAAMSSLYSDAMTAEEVSKLHSELFAALGEGARAASTFKNERNPNKRLKLGLVSGDFHHQHPVNIFMQPVLARLDKQQFEVTIYHTGISHDEQTQLARKRVDHWVACATLTEVQLVRRIEADGIDIVMDLAGHTSLQRVAMYAQRVAPVQATFLGYPGSTGVPNIDWMLADSVVVPKGAEALCSEQVMRLPNTVFCYAPEANYPYPQYNETHAQRPLTFGSFNNVPKLTPHTIKLWAQVLKAVPDSRLLLKAPSFKDESAIKVFSERFEKEGIEAARLEFRGPVGLTDMMAEYADVDIALDPVPYNGGTTTLQAMWMGVPVVVKEGNNFVSRMGASFMRAAALPEWVAKDDAEYVKIAARMAKDRKALLKLKQGLRERQLALPAWNIDTYTRDMEKALRSMWTKFCKSK